MRTQSDRWQFPHLGVGLNLVSKHYHEALRDPSGIDFFEICTENFMQTEGYPSYVLDQLSERCPLLLHGVAMSIGSLDPFSRDYLQRLKALVLRTRSRFVSDHLCFNGVRRHRTHDFLPLPLTEEALEHVVSRIRVVQDFIEVPLLIENPSTYLEFTASSMPEWEFLARMCEAADCGLLLDINNIFVSGYNHGFDPRTYIDAIPIDRIVYHHLAGHTHMGSWIKDTHSAHVTDKVWRLYQYVQGRTGGRTTVIEWDSGTPEFEVLRREVSKARQYAGRPLSKEARRHKAVPPPQPAPVPAALSDIQTWLLDYVVQPQAAVDTAPLLIRPTAHLTASERADVYREQYWFRVEEEMFYYYPQVCRFLGRARFGDLVKQYVAAHPPDHYNIFRMRDLFPGFLRDPWLQDVAQVERAMRDLGDAASVPALAADVLPAVAPNARLVFTPAFRLLSLRYDVEGWLQGGQDSAPEPSPTYLMLYRIDFIVHRMPIQRDLYRLLRLLHRGVPLDVSVARAGGEEDVLQALLEVLVSNGLVTSMQDGPPGYRTSSPTAPDADQAVLLPLAHEE